MSKSLGNSPDPLDVIATSGADALRFTVLYLAPIGQDVLYSNEKCEMGRNFANKIWNAGRFLLMNRDAIAADSPADIAIVSAAPSNDLSDAWILSRFNATVKETTAALENLRVNEAVKMLYRLHVARLLRLVRRVRKKQDCRNKRRSFKARDRQPCYPDLRRDTETPPSFHAVRYGRNLAAPQRA